MALAGISKDMYASEQLGYASLLGCSSAPILVDSIFHLDDCKVADFDGS